MAIEQTFNLQIQIPAGTVPTAVNVSIGDVSQRIPIPHPVFREPQPPPQRHKSESVLLAEETPALARNLSPGTLRNLRSIMAMYGTVTHYQKWLCLKCVAAEDDGGFKL